MAVNRRWLLLGLAACIVFFNLSNSGPAPKVAATTLPNGFTQDVLAAGLNAPTNFAFLPDGRILIAEKSGIVRVYKNGALLPVPFIDIRDHVNDYWDRGLLGVAADPNFATNGFVYLLYSYEHDAFDYDGPKTGRLTRVTASGDTASPSTETVILGQLVGAGCDAFPAGADCIPQDWPSHGVGQVRFAPDGSLFVSTGDASNFNQVSDGALRAQSIDSLAGKILRITADGKGLSTNPFWSGDANSARSKVWAFGVRNAYRFSFRPETSLPYVGDVGWSTWEEISVASAGANLGWPCYEGNAIQGGYEPKPLCQTLYSQGAAAVRAPLYTYTHNGLSSSVTAGAFYTSTAYPMEFRGAYFFGDYARGWIRYLKVDANNILVEGPTDFAAAADGPVTIESGPDGSLYYLAINTGQLRRIRYIGPVPAGTSYLSDAGYSVVANGYGPVERNMSNGENAAGDGRALTLNGVTYAKGLGTHAPSDVRYALNAGCTSFSAEVGVDDEVGTRGSVVFQVWTDGTKVYDSGVVTGSTATKSVSVDVTGKNQLQLIVTDGGDGNGFDHGDWAQAQITCGSGSSASLFSPSSSFQAGTATHGVTAGDVNGDGREDLVAASHGSSNVSVFVGNGNGTFQTAVNYAVGSGPKQVAIGQFNADTKPDLVSANQEGNSVSVLLNNGDGTFASAVDYPVCSRGHEVAVGDLNGDTRQDLAVACWNGTVISVLLGLGNGTFSSAVNYQAGSNPHSIVIGEFNADGKPDLAVANHGSGNVSVLLGNGDGSFRSPVNYSVGTGPHSIRSGDLNGDTFADLVTANDGSDNVSVLLGNGDGTFRAVTHFPAGRVPKGVAIGDLNADGKLDIVTANTGGSYPNCCQPGGDLISVLLGIGNGTFGSPTDYRVGQTPFAALIHDLNRDGKPDIATANWHSNDVTVLLNQSTENDVTPPTVVSVSPAENSTGVLVDRNITATFSDAMDPSSLSVATVTVAQQGMSPIDSTVTYEPLSRTVTLDPAANLALGQNFTATVKGGAGGAKDAAGNPLAADKVWTFSTSSVRYLSDTAFTVVSNGYGPVERNMSNGESAAGDGRTLTLNGVTYAKGLGTHAPSDVRYALNAGCTSFSAEVGVDDEVGTRGSVVFQVWTDGTKVYDSGVMTGSTATKSVNLDLTGKNQLQLVVTDAGDANAFDHGDWANAILTCSSGVGTNTPPTVTIASPSAATTFRVGDVVTYSGSATDAQDGTIAGQNLHWQISLRHCPPTDCHTHLLTSSTGSTGSFTVPDHGDSYYFEITLEVTDSGGLTGSSTVSIQPQTSHITLTTLPAGLRVVYGGETATAPLTRTAVVGSVQTIHAPSPQGDQVFSSWSDGGAQQHEVTSGTSNATYTARFNSSSATNLATGKTASQSSTALGATANRAVDGNTTGNWSQNSVTHTNYQQQPWWEVDLGAAYQLQEIKVWNRTDCCSSRLSNFHVFVSDTPFASTNLAATQGQAGVSDFSVVPAAGAPTTVAVNRTGRYIRIQLTGTDYLSIAEVQVIGVPAAAPTPVATQSSTALGATASRAIDGNTNGNWAQNSVTHTNLEAQPWWEVDLGSVQSLTQVQVWNRTDCCQSRLSNFHVLVSDVPFVSRNLAATQAQPGVTDITVVPSAGTPTTVTVNRTGRYVRVQLTGTNYLSLAEVQFATGPVTPPTPVAMQSSTALGATADRAIDGNTNGNWSQNSVTHTNYEPQPWWEVDLGTAQSLSQIQVWNRADCCQNRLSNFHVFVSDAPFTSPNLAATQAQAGVSDFTVAPAAGAPTTVAVNRTGRYIRIQLTGTDYLSIAEVQWTTQ